MKRWDIINALGVRYKYKSMLELGTQWGECLEAVNYETKLGVDPDPNSAAHINLTSDQFFEMLPYSLDKMYKGEEVIEIPKSYDLIFCDGWHSRDQALRDIENSLKILNPKGTLIVHDCLPINEEAMNPYLNGDVWRAIVDIRCRRNDIIVKTINTDQGCAIIQFGSSNKLEVNLDLDWKSFLNNKQEWLQIISVSEFQKIYLV